MTCTLKFDPETWARTGEYMTAYHQRAHAALDTCCNGATVLVVEPGPGVIDCRQDWPFPWLTITDLRRQHRNVWAMVDPAAYYEYLEMLPPAGYASRAFAMGEPASHDDQGRPIHAVFASAKGPAGEHLLFVQEIPLHTMAEAVAELRAFLLARGLARE